MKLPSKIDTLNFEVLPPENTDDWGDKHIDIKIYINDANFSKSYPVDLYELIQSSIKPRDYDIITCGCGVRECAGLWEPITVNHLDAIIQWQVIEPEPERLFSFNKVQYVGAVRDLLQKIEDIKGFSAHLPAPFKDWDLRRTTYIECMAIMREMDDA